MEKVDLIFKHLAFVAFIAGTGAAAALLAFFIAFFAFMAFGIAERIRRHFEDLISQALTRKPLISQTKLQSTALHNVT